MFKDKKVIVVMPAYNAAKTLCKTYEEVMAQQIVDLVILVLMQAMMKLLLYETCGTFYTPYVNKFLMVVLSIG